MIDLARFTVDEDSNICLDGKPIEVKKMVLTKWQSILGAMVAISTTTWATLQTRTWLGIGPLK